MLKKKNIKKEKQNKKHPKLCMFGFCFSLCLAFMKHVTENGITYFCGILTLGTGQGPKDANNSHTL